MTTIDAGKATPSDRSDVMIDEWHVVPAALAPGLQAGAGLERDALANDSGQPQGVLSVEAAVECDVMSIQAGELRAVLSVVAPPVDCTARAPLRLVAVLDKSGSMRGEKLRLVKETMLFMLRHLSERDALGIVEYDTQVKVAAPLTFCSGDGRLRLEAALKRLQAGSQTNLSGGLLRGLELHRNRAQHAMSCQVQSPLQSLRFGNTYRRMSVEEATEKDHYGHPGAMPPSGTERIHEWTMMMRFQSADDEALVHKVVYNLHETFRKPTVEVLHAPFQLTRFGWGTFVVSADVHLHDGRIHTVRHQLRFDQPEAFQTLLLPLRHPPAGIDYYVNGTKKLRVTSLRMEHRTTSLRNPGAQGQTLHMDGVSYGAWKAQRRTTVPAEQSCVAERVMALFNGTGGEKRIEFEDTDGDSIVFLAGEGAGAGPNTTTSEEAEEALVRSTFLFTDGLANVGVTKSDDLCATAEAALGELGSRRCSLSTFGFGKDHNADLLQGLAERGDGIYSYVEGEDRIGDAFGEALGGLLSTTHHNVSLSLELAPSVGFSRAFTAYEVEGPSVAAEGSREVRIHLGDLFAEERRDILVALTLPEAAVVGPQGLGLLRARGFSVRAKLTETVDPVPLAVERRSDVDVWGPSHPQVERHWNRHVATEALEAGRMAAQAGDLAGARRRLAAACEVLSASPLTQQGDSISVGLLADLNECIADLRHEETYRSFGSKKMACMKGAHTKQRACFGQDFSAGYSNSTMQAMGKAFDKHCK